MGIVRKYRVSKIYLGRRCEDLRRCLRWQGRLLSQLTRRKALLSMLELLKLAKIPLTKIMYVRSCSGFVTSSPTMVCMTPILPFRDPPIARPASATQMFDANPTIIKLRTVPKHPASSTGFRPILSDKPPQYIPVKDSANAKAEIRSPA